MFFTLSILCLIGVIVGVVILLTVFLNEKLDFSKTTTRALSALSGMFVLVVMFLVGFTLATVDMALIPPANEPLSATVTPNGVAVSWKDRRDDCRAVIVFQRDIGGATEVSQIKNGDILYYSGDRYWLR